MGWEWDGWNSCKRPFGRWGFWKKRIKWGFQMLNNILIFRMLKLGEIERLSVYFFARIYEIFIQMILKSSYMIRFFECYLVLENIEIFITFQVVGILRCLWDNMAFLIAKGHGAAPCLKIPNMVNSWGFFVRIYGIPFLENFWIMRYCEILWCSLVLKHLEIPPKSKWAVILNHLRPFRRLKSWNACEGTWYL